MSQMSLDFALDRGSEVPLGTQLIWKLRTLIAAGRLTPGDQLPGIREIAEHAGVNVNTVRSVLGRLEEQGLLVSQHGRGTFIAPEAKSARILSEMAATALAQAQEADIDPRELAAALYVTPDPDERAERRAIRNEITRLERDVAALDPIGTLERPKDTAAPRVLTTPELRATRDLLAERLAQLRSERELWRMEAEDAERAERQAEAERTRQKAASRWREAGVWTGQPRVRVSWISP